MHSNICQCLFVRLRWDDHSFNIRPYQFRFQCSKYCLLADNFIFDHKHSFSANLWTHVGYIWTKAVLLCLHDRVHPWMPWLCSRSGYSFPKYHEGCYWNWRWWSHDDGYVSIYVYNRIVLTNKLYSYYHQFRLDSLPESRNVPSRAKCSSWLRVYLWCIHRWCYCGINWMAMVLSTPSSYIYFCISCRKDGHSTT